MKNQRIKIAILGGGINSAVGKIHISSLRIDNKYEIIGGCFSRNKKINLKSGLFYGLKKNQIFHNLDHMLSNVKKNNLTYILILVPTIYHYDVITKCINNNFNVISEKTLCTSSKEINKLIKIKKNKNKKIYPISNYLGYPMIQEINSILKKEKNKIGQLIKININMYQNIFLRRDKGKFAKPQIWRRKDLQIPIIFFDLGIHIYSIYRFLINLNITKIHCIQNNFGLLKNIVDDVSIICQTKQGILLNFNFSKSLLGHTNDLEVNIYGKRGSIKWRQKTSNFLEFNDLNGKNLILDYANASFEGNHNNAQYHRFKAGHPNGYLEAFCNYYNNLYQEINGKKNSQFKNIFSLKIENEFLKFCEICQRSNKKKKWYNIKF